MRMDMGVDREVAYCRSCYAVHATAGGGSCSRCGAPLGDDESPASPAGTGFDSGLEVGALPEERREDARPDAIVSSLLVARSILALLVFVLLGGLALGGLARYNQAAQAASVARQGLIGRQERRRHELQMVRAALEVLYRELMRDQERTYATAAERIIAQDRWRRRLRLVREKYRKYQLDSSYFHTRGYDDAEEALNAAMASLSALQLHLERGEAAEVAALRMSFEQSLEDARSALD